jgi:hypothetical protein
MYGCANGVVGHLEKVSSAQQGAVAPVPPPVFGWASPWGRGPRVGHVDPVGQSPCHVGPGQGAAPK